MQPQRESDPVIVLQQEMGRGSVKLFNLVPLILREVIEDRLWAGRIDKKSGKPFATFEAFVVHRLQEGLESTVDDLLAYCRKEPEVQAMIRGELAAAPAHGGARAQEQVANSKLGSGTEATYTLRRLKRDAPELAARVIAGEISAHAAAIEAGFRQRTVTLPADPRLLALAIITRYPDVARFIRSGEIV